VQPKRNTTAEAGRGAVRAGEVDFSGMIFEHYF